MLFAFVDAPSPRTLATAAMARLSLCLALVALAVCANAFLAPLRSTAVTLTQSSLGRAPAAPLFMSAAAAALPKVTTEMADIAQLREGRTAPMPRNPTLGI